MPGGAPGLQNQCGAEKVPGGFDSHSPPPFLTVRVRIWGTTHRLRRIRAVMDSQDYGKTKVVVLCGLILLGGSLLIYGTLFHSTTVSAQQDGQPVMLAKSESALIKDASVSGVKRDETGKIKQTYEIGEKAPAACST